MTRNGVTESMSACHKTYLKKLCGWATQTGFYANVYFHIKPEISDCFSLQHNIFLLPPMPVLSSPCLPLTEVHRMFTFFLPQGKS